MLGSNTELEVYIAPKDLYTYQAVKKLYKWHTIMWAVGMVKGAKNLKLIENMRRKHDKWTKPSRILGWDNSKNKYYTARESDYVDVFSDPQLELFQKIGSGAFKPYMLGGGTSGKYNTKILKDKNRYIHLRSPYIDLVGKFTKNGLWDLLYTQQLSWDEAIATFNNKGGMVDEFLPKSTIKELIRYYKDTEGMTEEEAYNTAKENALSAYKLIQLEKYHPLKNKYLYIKNVENRFEREPIREMLSFKITIHHLLEWFKEYPNLSLYVLDHNNVLRRIEGIVGKQCQNIVLNVAERLSTQTKQEYNLFHYSMSYDTLVCDSRKGFIPVNKFTGKSRSIKNLARGDIPTYIQKRYNSEYLYDLVIDYYDAEEPIAWIDAYDNIFIAKDYSKRENLIGIDLIC